MPLVAILLGTYNGERFLVEQLRSIESQEHTNWVVYASDDGSTDKTLEILLEFQHEWPEGKLIIRQGPKKGFAKNFLSLACDDDIRANYYAFCDQDDVWMPKKLSAAIDVINNVNKSNGAFIYCGRTQYVTEKLKSVGKSPLFIFPTSFRNSLVQSIAGGNTMVFNQEAKNLFEQSGLVSIPSHDWWGYQLITGAGGEVYYDPRSFVLYRQHRHSLIGANTSYSAKLKRILLLMQGRYKDWNTINIEALYGASSLLTNENLSILNLFKTLRQAKIKDRFRLMQICGLYRQTRDGTLSLYIAAIIGKV